MDPDRRLLAASFDGAATDYHQARPGYPPELFDALGQLAGLTVGARLLEIGPATGTATEPLARRGYAITAVEPGPRLAAQARRVLAGYGRVRIDQARFEDWRPQDEEPFDLVYAATAWHWIDPAVRYRRAWEHLRPGGHLALWQAEHVFPDGGDEFFRGIQDVYAELGLGHPAAENDWPRPGEQADLRAEIAASGRFAAPELRWFDWETSYTAEGYLRLLDTFSSHRTLSAEHRDALYGEIRRRLTARPDGRVRRGWGAVLHVAPRLDRPAD